MTDLRNEIIRQHIDRHYPNARAVPFTAPESALQFYTEPQLQQLKGDWFPLSCHRDAQTGQLLYGGREDVTHTYTIGETGAGKTTRFVMQSIRALASTAAKPSFLVTDMHGEIVENLYTHLKKNGYAVKILNCDEPSRSDTYNPFAAMVARCRESGQLDEEAHALIRKIAEIMQPVQSKQDPIWDMGARSYAQGCILDKMEDLLVGKIPPKCITLYNIIENHYWLRRQLQGDGSYRSEKNLQEIPHYAQKPKDAMSVQKIIAVTDNADKTRRSYWGVVENHYDVFGQRDVYALSSSSTIDVQAFLEQPTAIIVQSCSGASGDHLTSMLVNDIYNAVVRKGKQSRTKRLDRDIHCFLDEFANCHIAEGVAFVKMLTTSRKFGMHWHMLLQSDAQLERKYDRDTGSIVRANCTEIFLGSCDHDTATRFAKGCGTTTFESVGSLMARQAPVLEVRDLITADQLNLMAEGSAYVRSRRHRLLQTYFEASYKCPEFAPVEDIDQVYPHNQFDYRLTAFFPEDNTVALGRNDLAILDHLNSCSSATETELTVLMPRSALGVWLQRLTRLELVRQEQDRYYLNISPAFLEKLRREVAVSAPAAPEEDWFFPGRKRPAAELELPQEEPEVGEIRMIDGWERPVKEVVQFPLDLAILERMETLSCMPEELKQLLKQLRTELLPETATCQLSTLNVLKFEIIEAFITNNNFASKSGWVRRLRAEVGEVERVGCFQPEVAQAFRQALTEVDQELTLNNIREIKKIINDQA